MSMAPEAATDNRPNPSAAPVAKIRLRYAKRGKLRFASHRDVARSFERAVRRAGIPMAYSQGFNPHPKISWVGAAPTGCASEAEYVELAVVRQVDPEAIRSELDGVTPSGLDVLDAVVAGPGGLADRIDASEWLIELPGVAVETLADAMECLMGASEVLVERMTKGGARSIDVRAALVRVTVGATPGEHPATDRGPSCGILRVVVRQVSPAVRPDDILNALDVVAGLRPPVPAKALRTAQGRLDDDGCLIDPLGQDRVL